MQAPGLRRPRDGGRTPPRQSSQMASWASGRHRCCGPLPTRLPTVPTAHCPHCPLCPLPTAHCLPTAPCATSGARVLRQRPRACTGPVLRLTQGISCCCKPAIALARALAVSLRLRRVPARPPAACSAYLGPIRYRDGRRLGHGRLRRAPARPQPRRLGRHALGAPYGLSEHRDGDGAWW